MQIHFEHLPVIFDHVKKLHAWLTTYCKGANKIPVSLDDITAGIKEIYGFTIEVVLVRFDSEEIKGFIEIYGDKATIYLDNDMNLGMTRYVFMKEACHIMVLTAENSTKDPAELIQYYVHERKDIDARKHPQEVVCEEVTRFGALELLYPPALRRADKDTIEKGQGTLFTVADGLQLPEFCVEYVLQEYYLDLCERIRKDTPDRERA